MKTSPEFIIFLTLFITLLMGSMAFLTFKRFKAKEYSHLGEFWGGLATMSLATLIFRNENPHILALSMVGWIWPLRGFRLMLEDLSASKIMYQWEYILLAAGGFISVAMASYGFSFTQFTLPFAVSVGVVGFCILRDAFKATSSELLTPSHKSIYAFMGLYFLSRLSFPVWAQDENLAFFGYTSTLISVIGFAAASLATYLEIMKTKHETELEEMLQERTEKLFSQSKFSELGMMSAGIAHEINNPLAVIQARTTQLLRIYRNPDRQKDLADGLQQILFTSERINKTIQGVREFVHQDERKPDTEISLDKLVDDVLSFCGQRLKNHGVNLRLYNLDKYTVRGNKIQLEQVILNLINNSFDAIEFLPDKWIEISVQENHDYVQIYVKDSGDGIPQEIAAKMMNPFFSTKDLGKGTGLGLALAQGIIEKHEGCLKYVENAPHTTFLMELPKVNNESDWGMPLIH